MHCTHEGAEAENGQSARAGYCTKKARSRKGPNGRKGHEAEKGGQTARRAGNAPKGPKRTRAQLKQHYRGASPKYGVNGLLAPGAGNRARDARRHPSHHPTDRPSAKRMDHAHGSQSPPQRAPAETRHKDKLTGACRNPTKSRTWRKLKIRVEEQRRQANSKRRGRGRAGTRSARKTTTQGNSPREARPPGRERPDRPGAHKYGRRTKRRAKPRIAEKPGKEQLENVVCFENTFM